MFLEIVSKGYGHAYTKYPFRQDDMDLFRAHERAARESKKGLWGEDVPVAGKAAGADCCARRGMVSSCRPVYCRATVC